MVFLSSYLGFFSVIADAAPGSLMVLRSCSGIGICISLPFVGEGKLSRTLRGIRLVHSSAVRWTELFVMVAIRLPHSCQSREPLIVKCVRNGEGLEVLGSFGGTPGCRLCQCMPYRSHGCTGMACWTSLSRLQEMYWVSMIMSCCSWILFARPTR